MFGMFSKAKNSFHHLSKISFNLSISYYLCSNFTCGATKSWIVLRFSLVGAERPTYPEGGSETHKSGGGVDALIRNFFYFEEWILSSCCNKRLEVCKSNYVCFKKIIISGMTVVVKNLLLGYFLSVFHVSFRP